MPSHRERLAKAVDALSGAPAGGILVAPGPDLVYLTGYDAPPLERLTALVLRPGEEPTLVLPELERARAADSAAADVTRMTTWRDGEDPYRAIARLLSGVGGRLAVSDRMWAVHLIELRRAVGDVEFSTASEILAPLRAVKDDQEVELLAAAGRAGDAAFDALLATPLEGMFESDVARGLGERLLDAGQESVAFAIVASGPNAASPHHLPGRRRIERGDAVVLDFGGRVGGYCSDETRTVAVKEASAEIAEVHEVVRRAQQAAFEAAHPGVPAQDVDAAARRVIQDAGYGEAFIHRTGHGIGLEEHEPPYIVEGNDEPLLPGMCFSIEPGIYLPGRFGVRIEDIVALTDTGVRRLNEAPRALVTVS